MSPVPIFFGNPPEYVAEVDVAKARVHHTNTKEERLEQVVLDLFGKYVVDWKRIDVVIFRGDLEVVALGAFGMIEAKLLVFVEDHVG